MRIEAFLAIEIATVIEHRLHIAFPFPQYMGTDLSL